MAAVPATMGVAMLVPAMGPISHVSPLLGLAFVQRACVGQGAGDGAGGGLSRFDNRQSLGRRLGTLEGGDGSSSRGK